MPTVMNGRFDDVVQDASEVEERSRTRYVRKCEDA